jgi:MFS family permease
MKAGGFLPTGTRLDNPDFASMAESMGIYGVRLEDPGQLKSALSAAFAHDAVRSSPAVMIPQLAKTFGVSTLGVSDILGTYYYTYSTASLVAEVLLDRLGAKYVVSTGMAILGIGCLSFMAPQEAAGCVGRLLQGAGSAPSE